MSLAAASLTLSFSRPETTESVTRGAGRLLEHGLSLDIWAYHTQLDEVLAHLRCCEVVMLMCLRLPGRRMGVVCRDRSPLELDASLRRLRAGAGCESLRVCGIRVTV